MDELVPESGARGDAVGPGGQQQPPRIEAVGLSGDGSGQPPGRVGEGRAAGKGGEGRGAGKGGEGRVPGKGGENRSSSRMNEIRNSVANRRVSRPDHALYLACF